jgi:hypothetical protein
LISVWNTSAIWLKPPLDGCISLCHDEGTAGSVPWASTKVTRGCDCSAFNIAANCVSISCTTWLDATRSAGKPRRSNAGFSHGPKWQMPRPSGIAKS